MNFASFISVHQHKRRHHRKLYMSDLQTSAKKPDVELMTICADVEATAPRNTPFLRNLMITIGATEDVVRHLRVKTVPSNNDYIQFTFIKTMVVELTNLLP
ncbi:hypothetical protein TcasGA2_TC001802 [Tribolium castaneum]|uniref:Uncharacterized protein n=1 Tax=Tribolium castaneum TaxID=7070 RepID=D7EKW4_TRICA|nr:hypothetical protein TcasGA2_TC001802 [Tribolium castaneum]